MDLTELFIAELTREAETTRRVLSLIPRERLTWKPHAKSMTLGQLALHIAGLPLGITELVTPLEVELPDVPLVQPTTVSEILATFDDTVLHATRKLAAWGDEGLGEPWRLASGGRTLLEMTRADVIRSILLNHTYHHRGQLTVYLRLLDVPLPPVYGPTADTQAFATRESTD
jgi:uncharacterized damage-inducible protein DinB